MSDEVQAKPQPQELEVETVAEYAQAVQYLETIVSRMKAGKVTVAHGEQTLTLVPSEQVKVQLKARTKEEKESISIKMSWRKENENLPGPDTIKIS